MENPIPKFGESMDGKKIFETFEKTLFEKFEKAFKDNQPDFLLYEISNANENAHSNLLERLLNHDQKFLQSFLVEVLGFSADTELKNPRVTTQEKAIGPKGTGFIDLYITNGEQRIIIENKIKDAGDTEKQLARYIATVDDNVNDDNFESWYNDFANEDGREISKSQISKNVYYLSRLGDKEPSPNSLPDNLRKALEDDNYKRLSYKDNILPWLKDTVMPQIPYQKNGLMVCAMLQYIAYLEYYTTTQDWQAEWIQTQKANILQELTGTTDIAKYNELSAIVDKITSEKGNAEGIDECTAAYISTLESVKEEIFAHDLDEVLDCKDWRIHYTPSFIVLYKQSWTELEERKYACPTIQISIHTPFHAKGFKDEVDVSLFITHVSALCVENQGGEGNGKFPDRLVKALIAAGLPHENDKYWDNHNRHFRISHKEKPIDVDRYKVKDKNDRISFYREVIQVFDKKIKIVDDVLVQMKAENDKMSN